VQQVFGNNDEMQVIALDPGLERVLGQALQGGGADGSGIEPGLADTLLRETVEAAKKQEKLGLPTVLLVSGNLRWLLSRFLRRAWPNLKVLSNNEIPETKTIKVTSVIGIKS
jgi:flagellar biosynthesis protein FlhA